MGHEWLKIRNDLDEDTRVIHMQEVLAIEDIDLLVGKLRRLWKYGDQQTVDGFLRKGTAAVIDRIVRFPGFCAALVEIGWLTLTPEGAQIVNFHDHISKSARERALTARRVAEHRARNGDTVTGPLPKNKNKKEKKSKDNPPTPQGGLPKELDTPEFREAWSMWFAYRAERRKPMTHLMVSQQVKFLLGLGDVCLAVQAIEQSIRAGWQGLFPPGRGGAHGAGNQGSAGKAQSSQERLDRIRAETLARREESERLRAESVPAGELFRKLKSNNEGNRHEQAEEGD